MARTSERQSPTSGSGFLKYIISAGIVGLGVAGMFGLKSLAKPPEDAITNALTPLVTTFATQPYAGQLDILVSGSVVPFREIKVAAEVSGQIKKKYEVCQAGSFVSKGTPLLEIDREDYQLELESLEADVNQSEKMLDETVEEIRGAKRNIELAKSDYQLQEKEFDRTRRMKNVLSQSELDVAERGLLTSQTQLTARKNTFDMLNARQARMEASLKLAKSKLNRVKLSLKRTTIYAPDDGIIVREMVEQGDYVSQGSQLFLFEDTSRAEVICNLTKSDLDWIRKNSTDSALDLESADETGRSVYRLPKTAVSIYESGEPEVTWQGVLERFDGIGRDELTKSIPCRIVVNSPIIDAPEGKRALVRGMYVKCRMEVQTSTISADNRFLLFPEVAVRPGNFVWVVRDHKLHRVDIEIADRTEALLDGEISPFVIVSADDDKLRTGDKIVRSPLSQPTENAEVLLEGEEFESKTTPVVDEIDTAVEKTADSSSDPATS